VAPTTHRASALYLLTDLAKMKQLLQHFRLRRDERWPALIVALLSLVLNTLFVLRLNPLFLQPGLGPYKQAMEREFHLAGYDPYTYWTVSEWDYYYNSVRHPLLAWMMWPVSMLNKGLEALLGVNCTQFLMALVLTLCTVYSFLFLLRIMREVVGLCRPDALLLAAFFFSMAYIMLSPIVPDHFTLSMTLLLFTLLVAGCAMTTGRSPSPWQWALLYFVTAGVTLTNGVKVVLAMLADVANRWRQLTAASMVKAVVAVLLPTAILIATAWWQQTTIAQPRQQSHKAMLQRKAEQERQRIAALPEEQQKMELARQARRQRVLDLQAAKTGKPVTDEGLLRWTDVSTSRWQSLYENMFGESILFHQEHFLEDTLVGRPVFVAYQHRWAYAIEAAVVLLFLMGVWWGRHSRFLWLGLGVFGIDLTVHLLLGFGLNEIHIMAPHWLFVVPIAAAYVFAHARGRMLTVLRCTVVALTGLLCVCNGYQLVNFLLTPVLLYP